MIAETAGRVVANGLPMVRAVAGPVVASHLRQTPPEDRTWLDACEVLGLAITDKLDGYLAGKIGPTALGARLDELGDKAFVIPQYMALKANGEIPAIHSDLKIARDIAVTGMRQWASSRGKDVKAGSLGKQKTAADMFVLAAANSPLAENEEILRAGLSISSAFSLMSSADYAVNFIKSDSPSVPTDNARNGVARRLATNPVNKIVELIDAKAPNVSPDHLTVMGEVAVMSSLILAVAKPDKAALSTGLYTFGSVMDGFDGALARLKGLQNGGTTLEGMLKDVRADKRQEIATSFALSLIARKRGNNVAANNYAVAAMTAIMPALYRAGAESQGYIVPEDGVGTRVMRGILGGAGMALNKNQDASDILSAVLATGNINTSKERRHIAKYGLESPYCRGTNFDPKFIEHSKVRHDALVPIAVVGVALGAAALAYRPEIPETSDSVV